MVHYYLFGVESYCLRRWQIRMPYGNEFATRRSCVNRGDTGLQYEPLVVLSGMNSPRIVAAAAMVS